MVLVAAAFSVVALLLAGRSFLGERALAAELRAAREELREVLERLASAERSAGDAASQAEAAGTVLLEKGLADEEELEAARRRDELPGAPTAQRVARILH
ncbi:MAG TPA: hypothetical protein VLV17_03105 [Anaeromyxobacteraceae bacterium]|nr:hypothetical protein [Anaeromyxobacteraceae bacterium]